MRQNERGLRPSFYWLQNSGPLLKLKPNDENAAETITNLVNPDYAVVYLMLSL